MTTKLEAMVGLLAGRPVDPAILDELRDPSSEASRFLEATRARSRALFGGPAGEAGPSGPARPRAGPRWAVAVAASTFIALGATLWAVDRRARALEAGIARRDEELRAGVLRVEALLAGLAGRAPAPEVPPPVEAALRRLEERLDRMGQVAVAPGPPKAESFSAQVREELAMHRRELSANEKAEARRLEEIQATIHDAARVLRLLLNRSQPGPPPPEPAPGFGPPRPAPGVDPRRTPSP